MERKPLNGEIMIRSSEQFTFSCRLQYMNSTDYSLIYKAEGKYKGKIISGTMIEYFPDDSADMYYDISRKTDNKIEIGKLSVKSFNKGRLKFREYYEMIADKVKSTDSELLLFDENNTSYFFIKDSIQIKENISEDAIKIALSVCRNAADISDAGFLVNCSGFIRDKNGTVIPAGAFVLPDSEENNVQKNILDFGLMFFRFIFGREATTFDRRIHSERKRSGMIQCTDISDEDFAVVCNIINRTIQHNRENCFADFTEILNEFEKLI